MSLSTACLAVPALGESESGVTGKVYTGKLFAIDFPKAISGEQKWTSAVATDVNDTSELKDITESVKSM